MYKMNYNDAREYTASLTSRGIVPGLETIGALCSALGDPQDKIRTIHIAGTNGKGSVGAFIASVLRIAGYSIGRYVSPAVTEYREIIRVNDELISEEAYAKIIEKVKTAVAELETRGIYPTSFEAETAAAFLYFSEMNCDYALIECGMGGALDATNIIKSPNAAVITSISMDHMSFLGNSLSEIAANKAGIIKQGTTVFSAMQHEDAEKVIREKCAEKNAHLTFAKKPVVTSADVYGTHFIYNGMELYIPLAGAYQPDNAALAAEVCRFIGVDDDTLKKGLKETKWQLRFEADSDGWIFDGAHNADAAMKLKASLDTLLHGKRTAFIVGVFRDKAYDDILKITAPAADAIYTVKPPSERGLPSAELARVARRYCENTIDAVTTENAVKMCMNEDFDNVVVFGSLSFLARIKREKEFIYEQMSKDN